MFKVPATTQQSGLIDAAGTQFAEDLLRFLASSGQKAPGIPHLNGRPVNLLLLYQSVISRGGWHKVCQQSQWESIAESTGLPKSCANTTHALKSLYYQYLVKYECTQFNRTIVEDNNDDEDAFKRYSFNSSGYQKIPDFLRLSCGLSSEVQEEDPFEKLVLQLSSGLPNEVDFAVNALLVRSVDGRHPMHVKPTHGTLFEALLATTGVFADHPGNLVGVYNSYIRDTDKDFVRYWKDTVDENDVLELLEVDDAYEQPLTTDTGTDLFSELPNLDANEIRVKQIGTVLLNLSIEEANARFFAQHNPCLRFIFLCANSKRGTVLELGLELLIQIAPKISIPDCEAWIQSTLFRTTQKCLESSDRLAITQGLTLLAKLCDTETSHEALIESLSEEHYTILSHNLDVPDTTIIIFSLEVLYKLSGLGRDVATRIATTSSNIQILVKLVTVTVEVFENISQDLELDPDRVPVPPSGQTQPAFAAAASSVTLSFPAAPPSADASFATVNWFRKFYEADDSFAMAMGDVYKDYVTFCNNELKITPVIITFISCFNLAFPQGQTSNLTIAGKPQLCFVGIKRRSSPGSDTAVCQSLPDNSSLLPGAPAPNLLSLLGSLVTSESRATLPKMISAPEPSSLSASNPFPAPSCPTPPVVSSSRAPAPISSPAAAQLKQGESSLIRTLLATKITRKHSITSVDGAAELNHSQQSPGADWKTQEDSLHAASTPSVVDGAFSDMESNDSFAASLRLVSEVAPSAEAVKEKPKRRRKPKVETDVPNHVIPSNGMVNGNSHLLSDDSRSSTSTPLVVPYVPVVEPKRVKKPRMKKKNGLVEPFASLAEPTVTRPVSNGHDCEIPPPLPVPEEPVKIRRKPGRKPKVKPPEDAPVNGHTAVPTEGNVKPKRRRKNPDEPAQKRGRKRKVEVAAVVSELAATPAPAVCAPLLSQPLNTTPVDSDPPLTYMCEWGGCNKCFGTPALVFRHNYMDHIPSATDGVCRWPHCNGVKRQSLSLITHLNETHCSNGELLRQAMRHRDLLKNQTSSIPPPVPLPLPGPYSEHAALHSIQARYGAAVLSDFASEPETSNTRTTRLTAALVLRNIAHYSHVGRIKLQRFEPILTTASMQQSEASQVIAECLYFMAVHRRSDEL